MVYTSHQKFTSSAPAEEFLPPISRLLTLVGIFLIGFVSFSIIISDRIKYNVIVRSAAVVRPAGEIRLVQSDMDGTVKNIFVKENQQVKLGDKIALLDNQQLLIKKSQLESNIQQSKLEDVQIDAQISALDSQILAEKRAIEFTVASAEDDLERNRREYQERQITTENEFLTAQASWQQSITDLQKAQANLNFAKVDRDRYAQLAQVGATSKRDLEGKKLLVQQAESTLQSEIIATRIARLKMESAKVAVNPTPATVRIALERIAEENATGSATIANLSKEKQALIERKFEIETQLDQSQKDLQQLETQLKSSIIQATSSGIIFHLSLRNAGQVVRSSESIAEIVPQNAPLFIKAMVPTADISKVAIGQKVQLRFDSCPYPDYGTLKGAVKAISPDAIAPLNNSSINPANTYFEVTVKPDEIRFGNDMHQCQIKSGMNAKADIVSKEETVLKFILKKARLITNL